MTAPMRVRMSQDSVAVTKATTSASPETTVTPTQSPQGGGAAYVPRAGGPPDTRGYMWAGYAVGLVLYGWYIIMLLRRHAALRRTSHSRR